MGIAVSLVLDRHKQRKIRASLRPDTASGLLGRSLEGERLQAVRQLGNLGRGGAHSFRALDVLEVVVSRGQHNAADPVILDKLGDLRIGADVGAGEAIAFAVALLCGGAIVYGFWLILATCSFWFVRVENILVIFQSMYEAGRWPVSIYPQWLRFALTFVVPVAFATTVPAQALTGRLTAQTLLGAVALAMALLAVSRLFWRVGIRYYSGASA
jgi:hypothetical protein